MPRAPTSSTLIIVADRNNAVKSEASIEAGLVVSTPYMDTRGYHPDVTLFKSSRQSFKLSVFHVP